MARATRSLPTPLSPASSTVERAGATRRMVAKISCMAELTADDVVKLIAAPQLFFQLPVLVLECADFQSLLSTVVR